MKIGIIGYGFVGKAVAAAYDPKDVLIKDPLLPNSCSYEDLIPCDGIFLCLPSPTTMTGRCDTSFLHTVLKELDAYPAFREIPLISKTTAPPAFYEEMQSVYPNLVHSPEFLTAANAVNDYLNSGHVILGGNPSWRKAATEVVLYGKTKPNFTVETDVKTAALFKYMMNSYLAMKVTFMNDFYELAKSYDIDWKQIVDLARFDERIGTTHMNVPGPDGKFGYGGACFPKDVSAIIEDALDRDVYLRVLEQVEEANRYHRSREV